MLVSEPEVTAWMEARGFNKTTTDGIICYYAQMGSCMVTHNFNDSASELCYQMGSVRHDAEGNVLNERGLIAQKGNIVLRDSLSGYCLARMGDEGIVKIKVIKEDSKDD
jgi:hypothetical protein